MFRDDLGVFTAFRRYLQNYYPDRVWRTRLAEQLHEYAAALQVNYARCMTRGDAVAAELCRARGVSAAMELYFLLAREYPPYYKWTFRALCALDGEGSFSAKIRELAEEGDAVFIGRCADYVLRDRPDLVRVFITAERDFRIQTVVEHSELTAEQAKKLIKNVDRDRAGYYSYYTDQTWGDAACYDLSLNVTRISVEGAVSIICSCVKAFLEEK